MLDLGAGEDIAGAVDAAIEASNQLAATPGELRELGLTRDRKEGESDGAW